MESSVSVVIPMSNILPTIISETIESCLEQTLQEYEILVVNNNAGPETHAAVNRYLLENPSKVRMVIEPRQGVCSATNRGILEAKGEYVAILEHDDLMYPRRLEIQLAAAQKHPEASLIYALFDIVSPDNLRVVTKGARSHPEFWRSSLFEPDSPLARVPTVLPSVMFFRKEIALRAGLFDEQFDPLGTQDAEWCVRMSEQGPFVCVEEPLVRHRTHPDGYLKVRQKKLLYVTIRNGDRFYRVLLARYGSTQSRRVRGAFRRMRGRWLREFSFLLFAYRSGTSLAKCLLRRSLKENPFDVKTWKALVRTCYPQSLWPSAFRFVELIDDPVPPEVNIEFLKTIFPRSLRC